MAMGMKALGCCIRDAMLIETSSVNGDIITSLQTTLYSKDDSVRCAHGSRSPGEQGILRCRTRVSGGDRCMRFTVAVAAGLVLVLGATGTAAGTSVLFVGNSFLFGFGSPVRFYRANTVTDL